MAPRIATRPNGKHNPLETFGAPAPANLQVFSSFNPVDATHSPGQIQQPAASVPIEPVLSADEDTRWYWLDSIQEAACVLDHNFHIVSWNRSIASLVGVAASAAEGKPLFELLPRTFENHLSPRLIEAREGRDHISGEFKHDHRGSDLLALRYKISHLPAANPTMHCLLLTFVDITADSRLAKERERQEHLQTLGVLSVGVAQEMTAPLDQICRYAEQIRSLAAEDSPERISNKLDSLVTQVYRISHLAHNLVALSQNSPGEGNRLPLLEMLEEVLGSWRKENDDRLPFRVHLPERLPEIAGDSVLLYTALQNLLRIALDLAGEDGVPLLTVSAFPDSRTLRITVADGGDGLPDKDIEQLFDFFYSNHSISPGTGLGLFISKRIVESMGGRFDIARHELQGTVFHMTFSTLPAS